MGSLNYETQQWEKNEIKKIKTLVNEVNKAQYNKTEIKKIYRYIYILFIRFS